MTTGTSKMFLPEPFTGSNDIERYITHFKLLAHLQKWKQTEMRVGNEVEIVERPHYFALRLQTSAIEFYRTFTDAQKGSYDETVSAFRNDYIEKPVVFRGQLASRIQHPAETLTYFCGGFAKCSYESVPREVERDTGPPSCAWLFGRDPRQSS